MLVHMTAARPVTHGANVNMSALTVLTLQLEVFKSAHSSRVKACRGLLSSVTAF